VILALAERWPAAVPDIVAADLDRRWMLMRDFGPRTLPGQPVHTGPSRAPVRPPAGRMRRRPLPAGARSISRPAPGNATGGDRHALGRHRRNASRPAGLTVAELAALRALAPRLIEKLSRLAGYAVPASIVQQDFRPENVALTDACPVFFDWSDTVIGHPFFALTRFLNFVPRDDGAARRRARRPPAVGGVEPSARLLETFELVRQLNAPVWASAGIWSCPGWSPKPVVADAGGGGAGPDA
jgi:hypothetical protein